MEPDATTPDDHGEWSSRAIAHVMGGLGAAESSEFRRHLLGCGRCKAQVNELRDLAGSLAVAAREERSQQATRLAERPEPDASERDDQPREPATIGGRTLLLVVVAVIAVGLLVWNNLHLRAEADAAAFDGDVVAGLGSGLVVEDVSRTGAVSGHVVADETSISWSFSDLGPPVGNEVVVVWLVPEQGEAELVPETQLTRPARDVVGGTVTDDTARELVITIVDRGQVTGTRVARDDIPGTTLVRADLSAVRRSADAATDDDG